MLNEIREDLRTECEKFGQVKKVLIFDVGIFTCGAGRIDVMCKGAKHLGCFKYGWSIYLGVFTSWKLDLIFQYFKTFGT